MARPLVLIFQELAQPTVTPETPDLSTIIVGPAYDLFDYPEDAASILLDSAYGELESDATYVPPVSGSEAVVVNDQGYPGQSAGSVVDHASVRPYLRLPHVVLASTYLDGSVAPVLGATVTTDALDQTLIEITGVATTDFVAAGIAPGDRIILTSSLGTQTVVRTVQSVGEPNSDGLVASGNEGFLRITQQLPTSGAGADEWTYDANAEVRIERTLVTQELYNPNSTLVTFPEPGTDKMVLGGGVTVPVALTPAATVAVPSPTTTTVYRRLSYAQVYIVYRALRLDLQDVNGFTASSVTTLNGSPIVLGLGKIDARNPLAVGVSVALLNSGGVTIFAYGVNANDATGHLAARGALESRRDLYCFVPLSEDINIHAAYKTQFDVLADPTTALSTGVVQKFRIVIGAIPLPTDETISSGSISAVSQQPSGASTGKFRTLSLASTSTGSLATGTTASVNVRQVLPGDKVTIGLVPAALSITSAWQNRRGTHTVGHVNSSKDYPNASDPSQLELIPASSRWDDAAGATSGDIEILVKAPDGTVKMQVLAYASVSTGAGGTLGTIEYLMKAPTVVGGPYTVNYAIDAGVASPVVTIVGFSVLVTVNGTTHDHDDVAAAINAHATVSALMTATVTTGGAQVVVFGTMTRTAVTLLTGGPANQTGALANTIAGAGVGNLRLSGLTGMTTSSVGRYITISGAASVANNGTFLVAAYVSPTSVDIVNASGVAVDANNGAITWTEKFPYTAISPTTGTATATVLVNDIMFNRLEDASASFLTDGVLPGDTIEIPLDPNDYTATAYDGRVLSYRVASVLNENRILIANGSDDTGSLANELPHYFARDYADRYIDNTTPNAQNYRVLRALSKDDMVVNLTATVQSARSKRLTVVWPDRMTVTDLRDGSLPRSVETTVATAAKQPGWALGCAVGGVVTAIPPQAGLTNGTFIGVTALEHAQGYFSETQLAQLSDGGLFVCFQRVPSALPECLHQLTTDTTALETGELSVVKNVDFVSMFFQTILETFLGQYNVLPETLNEINRAVTDGAADLKSRKIARVGAPLLEGTITSLAVSEFSADRVELYFRGKVPRPLNTIGFHLVV